MSGALHVQCLLNCHMEEAKVDSIETIDYSVLISTDIKLLLKASTTLCALLFVELYLNFISHCDQSNDLN